MATLSVPDIFVRFRANAPNPVGTAANQSTTAGLGLQSAAVVLGALPWDPNNAPAGLQALESFLVRTSNGSPPIGLQSVEVTTDFAANPAGGPVALPNGLPRAFSAGWGQAATGWAVATTAGNFTVTIAGTAVVTAFQTSQAITCANAVANINQNTTVNKYVTAIQDPVTTTRLLLVANTTPWDHVIGNQITLTAAGTGASASGATLGATNTAPAQIGVNAPSYAVNV